MEKKVSVVIPCYNVEKYIDRCISSLVNQTLGIDSLELIFVNDASTDSTYERLCSWERKYPESILVINCKENRKQGAARNTGLEYASAPYIGFVDSDDWVEPDMYEAMYGKAIETGADVIGVCHQREDAKGNVYCEEKAYNARMDVLCEVKNERYRGLPGGIWSGLFRKELIQENHIYFPENLVYEDNFWGVIIGYYIKSYYIINKVLYHYFVNTDSTIMQKDTSHHMDRLMIEKLKLEELKKRGLYEKNKDKIEFQFLLLYYINTLHMIFVRMKRIPYETICMMQEDVREAFPDFENNPYLYKLNWVEQFFLKTVRMQLSKEDWEEIRTGYLEDIRQAKLLEQAHGGGNGNGKED